VCVRLKYSASEYFRREGYPGFPASQMKNTGAAPSEL